MLCARIVTFSIIDALIFVLSLTYNIPFLEIVPLSGERQKDTRMFFYFFYFFVFVFGSGGVFFLLEKGEREINLYAGTHRDTT
jgi:hypothetical protein